MSNRLTFSLASLVLTLALGLVFAPVSVIAHTADPHNPANPADTHMHPVVTIVDPMDDDPMTAGIQVVDKAADTETGLEATIEFDVMVTLPSAGLDTTAGTGQIADTEVTAYARTAAFAAVGDGTNGAVGVIATADTTDPTMVTLALTITETVTDDGDTSTTEAQERAAGIAALIKAGLYVDIYVNAEAITVNQLVPTAVMQNQLNLQSRTLTVQVAESYTAPTEKSPATISVEADTYHGGGRFMVTFTFDAMDAPTAFMETDIMVTGGARVLPGSVEKVASPPTGKVQWTAIIESFLETNTADIVVTVTGSNVEPAATDGSVMVKDAADTPPATLGSGTYALSGSLPAKGFGVITRAATDGIASPVAMVAMMPNLQRFFAQRGSITLYTTDTAIKANDVVISEIMWGLNVTAATVAARDDHQWIELYNATNSAIDLSKIQINFHQSFALPSDDNKVDQISNVEHAGWTVDQGQNGSLSPGQNAAAVDLISMYRNINYDKIETELGKVTGTVELNRGERNKGVPNGRAKGSWITSNIADIYLANRIGSPGGKHIVVGGDYGATSVPRSPIIITEVGNLNGMDHDWIELTALANVNLEKYELQYVKSDKTIVVLAQFVKKELKAGEILLVLGTHPATAGHPVAAGKEWKLAVADQVRPNASSLYHVDSRMKLPDDIGKSTFILRKEKDKTNHEHIVDLAGNLFIADSSDAYRTNLWPLRAASAGHGNVIDGDVEDFNSGRAYQRNDRGSGVDEKDWNTRGFTGVGYDRNASGANAPGTPGYDNGFVRDKDSVLTAGSVRISEVMYEKVGNAPQWIELYNSSKTEGVNLNEWKLRIENDRDDTDVDIRFRPTIQFGGVHIPPNDTVLITSAGTGQNSGNFPRHRVIDLWANTAQRNELESADAGRNYRLLSTTAFKLTLIEKGGAVVDMVGNLDAAEAWELPASEAGERGSILREYTDREASDGTMGSSWTHASTSPLTHSPIHLYYGRRDDMGTPGYRAGGPLPVSLSKFRPERLETGEIVVRWITESELNNAGFNILRSEKRDGEFTKLNTKLIAGQGTTSERTTYTYPDTSAKPNVIYYYQIQDVSLEGQVTPLAITHLRGNVSAAGKLTTTWGELKALQ